MACVAGERRVREELDLGIELEIGEFGVDGPVPDVGDGPLAAQTEALHRR